MNISVKEMGKMGEKSQEECRKRRRKNKERIWIEMGKARRTEKNKHIVKKLLLFFLLCFLERFCRALHKLF